jgi:hypothetical protein
MRYHSDLARVAVRTWLSALLLMVAAGLFWLIWDSSHLLYATPETESAFLKSYTPQPVIERFQCNNESSSRGCGAGKHFVTHQASFNWFFAMRPDQRLPLMTALDDDVAAQLHLNGAQILSRSGDFHSGFRYDYRLGKSIGRVTISPVSLDSSIHRSMPLPKCMVDVATKIELAEKWYPKEETAVQASLNSMP